MALTKRNTNFILGQKNIKNNRKVTCITSTGDKPS